MVNLKHINKLVEITERLMDEFSEKFGSGHKHTLDMTSLWTLAVAVSYDIEKNYEDAE